MLDAVVLPFIYASALLTGYIMGAYGPTCELHKLENRIRDLEDRIRKALSDSESTDESTDEFDYSDMPELVTGDHMD